MKTQEIYQMLIRKEYSEIKKDLLKYFELYKNEHVNYTSMYNKIFSDLDKFDLNNKNPENEQENKLIYLLVNIFEELPEDYFVFRTKFQELEEWEQVKNSENRSDFYDFISKYPDFKYIDILQQKFDFYETEINEIEEWKSCVRTNTVNSYSEYQKNNPNGVFLKHADEKIDEIKSNNKRNYLKNIVLHEKYWNHVTTENSVESHTNYLKYFPEGIHRINAELKLKAHSDKQAETEESKQKNKKTISKRTKIIALASRL